MARTSVATQKQQRIPLPVGGLNSVDNPMMVEPQYALLLDNMIPRPNGLEIRGGYREWMQTGTAFSFEVATLMSYISSDGLEFKFAATADPLNNPIYDITTPNTVPGAPFNAGGSATVPGEWYSEQFATPAGNFLCALLPGVGYFQFNGTAWSQVADGAGPGQVSFVNGATTYFTTDMDYIFSWKSRLWFIQRNTALAWYLPINSLTGAAQAFNLGQFLKHGGGLAYAFNWTYDSGAGMDDRLVFVGYMGDMVVYAGTDPSTAADFRQEGIWFIGRVPGKRSHAQNGGTRLLLTEFGILSVTDLVSGKITNPTLESTAAPKYNTALSEYIANHLGEKYWQIVAYPKQDIVFVASPASEPTTETPINFVMNTWNSGWATASNMPAYCCMATGDEFLFGTTDGRIYQGFYGSRDGDSYDGSVVGAEVTGQILGAFQDFGTPTANKVGTRVRLSGRSDGLPSYIARLRSETDIVTLMSAPVPASYTQSIWDVDLWDMAVWGLSALPFGRWFGVAGFGKKLSPQLAVRGLGTTIVTDIEITFKEGIGL